MKKMWAVVIMLLLLATSCSGTEDETIDNKATPDQSRTEIKEEWDNITDEQLDVLIENFTSSNIKSIDKLNLDEEVEAIPTELINDVKKALYQGTSDDLLKKLNDKTLMITLQDFSFKPEDSENIDFNQKELNKIIHEGAEGFYIYKCDIDGDGIEEIIMIENLKYDYSHSNTAYILKKQGDNYEYYGYDYIGYYRVFALFEYEGKFYIAANFDDYKTKITKGIGLYDINDTDGGFMWMIKKNHTYITKINNRYVYSQVYKNENHPLVSGVESYIGEIETDLIYTERNYSRLYGDEIKREDILAQAKEKNSDFRLREIYSIDVNNDGYEDFFCKKYNNECKPNELLMYWYNQKTILAKPSLLKSFNKGYVMRQQWFKIIEGKTVMFSLYQRRGEEKYMLDARIFEDGQMHILMDYTVELEDSVKITDYWDYNDSNFVNIDYKYNEKLEERLNDNIEDEIVILSEEIQGEFTPIDFEKEDIPENLIKELQEYLMGNNAIFGERSKGVFLTDKDEFYKKYGQYTYYDAKNDFDRFVRNIYKYDMDNGTYYLTVADSGGSARLVDMHIYKESCAELESMTMWTGLDINAFVISYKNNVYFIERSYNYNSKYWDTVFICNLKADKIKKFIGLQLIPTNYTWKQIYDNNESYNDKIARYIDGIKEEIIEKSPMDDGIEIYIGDENNGFDNDKNLRLRSVGGYDDYYEVDFNNDGLPEYIKRNHWFPSNFTILHLQNEFYKFTSKRAISINASSKNETMPLIQLWFKEIDGKVFTFRLYLADKYNYFLNVSLVEGTSITEVQNYIVVAKEEIGISINELDEK